MAMEYTQAYCVDCDKRVRAERKGTSHILHLLLTVFTLGIWIIVWIGSAIKFGGWCCPQCGGRRLKFKSFGIGSLPKSGSQSNLEKSDS